MTITAAAKFYQTTRTTIYTLLRRQGLTAETFQAMSEGQRNDLLGNLREYKRGHGLTARIKALELGIAQVRAQLEELTNKISREEK